MLGIDDLLVAAGAGLTGLITEVIKKKGGKRLEQIDVDLTPAKIERAAQQYIQNYADRHGALKVACIRMDKPVSLDAVYTNVQLLNRSELRYFESTDALQDLFRQSGQRGFELSDSPKRAGIAVANQEPRLLVLVGFAQSIVIECQPIPHAKSPASVTLTWVVRLISGGRRLGFR